MSITFSKYYSELENNTKERHDEKSRQLKVSEYPLVSCLSRKVGY